MHSEIVRVTETDIETEIEIRRGERERRREDLVSLLFIRPP